MTGECRITKNESRKRVEEVKQTLTKPIGLYLYRLYTRSTYSMFLTVKSRPFVSLRSCFPNHLTLNRMPPKYTIYKNVTKLNSSEYVVHINSCKEKLDVCQRISLRNALPDDDDHVGLKSMRNISGVQD